MSKMNVFISQPMNGRSIEVLAKADLAVFMNGWENARGCRIEHQAAKNYSIPTLELNSYWYSCT